MVLLALMMLAAAGPGEPLTPERAVALALAGHPALRAADREIGAAEADRALARSGWLPRVDVVEDVARSTNPVFVFASKLGQERFGPADFAVDALNRPDALTNAATRIAVRQNVWDAGRTHLYGLAAGAGIDAARGARDRSAQEVAFGAIKAFWDVVLADAMREVASTAEAAAAENARLAGSRAEEGLAVPSDRMQAEVRLAEVRALRIRADAQARVARAALRLALGTAEDRDFALAPPEVAPGAAPASEDDLVRAALRGRGDLKMVVARSRQAVAGERIARSGRLPEIGLGAQYEWNATNPFGHDGDNWTVGATVRLPLFDGLETRARAARARADRERLDAYRVRAEEGARLEVRSAVADVDAASERLTAAQSALGLSDEALRIVRERYGEGLAVMVELLGAEAAATAARGAHVQAVHDLAVARAALDLAAGGPAGQEGR